MTDFTGVPAVLHTPTVDRRQLDEPGPQLTRPYPLPLRLPGAVGEPVGIIEAVWRDGDLIRYSGRTTGDYDKLISKHGYVGNLDADDVQGMDLAIDDPNSIVIMHGWRVVGATLMPPETKAWPEVELTLT